MMNLTQTLIEESRNNPGKFYDDTVLPGTRAETRVKAHEAPATCSLGKAPFNPFEITPLGEHQVAATSEDLACQLDQLLDVYANNGLDCETTSMAHPSGILGVICQDEPALAKALLAARLSALKTDITSWWTGHNTARKHITTLEALLQDGDLEAFLPELFKYEKQHSKVPFCQIVEAKFVAAEDHEDTSLFVPFKGTLLPGIFAQHAAALQMQREVHAGTTGLELCDLPVLKKTRPDRTTADLVRIMVLAEPDTVLDFLIGQCRHGLNQVRARSADLTRPLSTEDRPVFAKFAQQLQSLYRLGDRADIEAFLADPDNADLYVALQQRLADLYLDQLQTRIQTTELAGMTDARLSDMESSLAAFEFTIANFPGPVRKRQKSWLQ